jgi:hypothetical protein
MNRYVYHAPVEPHARANASGSQNVIRLGATPVPMPEQPCPAWGCDGPPRFWLDPPTRRPVGRPAYPIFWFGPGATATTPQPPPSTGNTLSVPDSGLTPVSPQPSPTVSASTDLSLTQPGSSLAQQTGTPWDLGTWLGESTLITGFPNWGVAAAGAVAAYLLLGGKGGRR